MQAYVVGPVKIELGGTIYQEVVYVAPIDDDMLLGFDFLMKYGARLDMRRNEMELGDKIIGLQLGDPLPEPRIARVSVDKRKVIPPNSVAKIKCKLSQVLTNDYTLQGEPSSKYLIPRSVHSKGQDTIACVMNVTDNFIVMKKGMILGTATEYDSEVLEYSGEAETPSAEEANYSPCGLLITGVVIGSHHRHLTRPSNAAALKMRVLN